MFNPRNFWEKRLFSSLDLRGVGYSVLGLSFNVWMYRVRKTVFKRALRTVSIGDTVLDVGSGTGFYLEILEKLGKRTSGIDLSSAAVKKLREKFPHSNLVVGDIGSAGLIAKPLYSAVTAMDVLFHITEDAAYESAIRNIYDYITPGGYFFYAENLPESRIALKHQVSRSRGEVMDTLSRVGFTVVSEHPMFFLMNQPVASSSHFLKLWWRMVSGILIRFPGLGYALGLVLYPLEMVLVRFSKSGPSTKLLVCRK